MLQGQSYSYFMSKLCIFICFIIFFKNKVVADEHYLLVVSIQDFDANPLFALIGSD